MSAVQVRLPPQEELYSSTSYRNYSNKVNDERAYGEYLGIKSRRRALVPTICFMELELSCDMKIPE